MSIAYMTLPADAFLSFNSLRELCRHKKTSVIVYRSFLPQTIENIIKLKTPLKSEGWIPIETIQYSKVVSDFPFCTNRKVEFFADTLKFV